MLRLAAQLILLAVLLVSPWCYGAVYASTQVWLLAGLLAALALDGIRALLPRGNGRAPPTLLDGVLWLAIVWSLFQLVPMPAGVLGRLSPGTVGLRAELDPASAALPQTLTLRPYATRYDLTLLVIGTVALVLGRRLFQTGRSVVALLGLVTLNGTAFAFFGLIQKLTWNGRLYWVGIEEGGDPFAAYVNRNSAGGYLNLCLGAALGLLLWVAARGSPSLPWQETREEEATAAPQGGRRRVRRGGVSRRSRARSFSNLRRRWAGRVARMTGLELLILLACVVLGSGVLATLSRGAGISLFAAGIAAALALAATRGRRMQGVWILAAMGCGLSLIAWLGMAPALQARFGTLEDPQRLMASGRWPNWMDALKMVPDFPWTGTGLGTYRDVYLLYQDRFAPGWFHYAENQYLQALTDAGAVGLGLLVAALGAAGASVLRVLRRGRAGGAAVEYALAMAALFALVSQAVHASVDFGLYLPPNMLLLAVLCGGVAAAERRGRPASTRHAGQRLGAALTLMSLAGLLALGGPLWRDLRSRAAVHEALLATNFVEGLGGATDQQLDAAARRLAPHLPRRSDDAELHYRWATLHMHRYRLARLAALRAAESPEVSLETLWQRSSPAWVISQGEALRRDEMVKDSPAQEEWLRIAYDALLAARRACPILAKVHLRLAPLSARFDGSEAAWSDLARAVRCEPSSTFYSAEAGRLHFAAGRPQEAFRLWRRSLSVRPEYLASVRRWSADTPPQQLVQQAFPTHPGQLIAMVTERLRGRDDGELREHALTFALEQLEGLPEDAERAGLHGQILALQGRLPEAVQQLAISVDRDPGNAARRYELAVLLQRYGKVVEARQQARIAVTLDPAQRRYRRLLEGLMSSQ